MAFGNGVFRDQATGVLMLACGFQRGGEIVRRLALGAVPDTLLKRRVIRACGLLGDTQFVPWLIELMNDDVLARMAGESFTLISGADLAARPGVQAAARRAIGAE